LVSFGRIHRTLKSRRAEEDKIRWLKAYCGRRAKRLDDPNHVKCKEIDVFIDECWIWRNGGSSYSWFADDSAWGVVKAPAHKWGIVTTIIRSFDEHGVEHVDFYKDLHKIWQIRKKTKSSGVSDNLDGPRFEKWFKNVCDFISENHSGKKATFHLDNASFHKRISHKVPDFETATDLEMALWLVENSHPEHGQRPTHSAAGVHSEAGLGVEWVRSGAAADSTP